jgi:serine protease Do
MAGRQVTPTPQPASHSRRRRNVSVRVVGRAALAGLALCLAGCVALDSATTDALATVYIEEIEQLLEAGEPLDAVERIAALERDPDVQMPAAALQDLRQQAISTITASLEQAVADQEFLTAVALRRSLGAVAPPGADLAALSSIGGLYQREIERLAAEGDTVPALMLALGLIDNPAAADRSAGDYQKLLGLAASVGNDRAAGLIAAVMRAQGIVARPHAASPRPEYAAMLEGMVTVLVDRGIDIRRGVGFPDRVIGSGFFIDSRGYLLTNHHVIQSEVDPEYDGFSRLSVLLSANDDEKIPARVVGYDRIFDLALLKAEIEPSFVFKSAARSDLEPGDRIIAIGSPGGLSKTITSGIVSAAGRRFLQLGDAIQVDAPLNPGNSGGPLLNQNHELVGITFAGLEQFEGINFGISFEWIQEILPKLYRGGEVSHQWLGLFAFHDDDELHVGYVLPGSPAARSGLLAGDVIVTLDGAPAGRVVEMQRQLLGYDVPTLIPMQVRRDQQLLSFVVSLEDRPHLPVTVAVERDTREAILVPLFGLGLELLNETLFVTEYRVTAVVPGSIAAETGISVGDPIRIEALQIDEDVGAAFVRLFIKKRQAGFLENVVLLAAPLDVDSFL